MRVWLDQTKLVALYIYGSGAMTPQSRISIYRHTMTLTCDHELELAGAKQAQAAG